MHDTFLCWQAISALLQSSSGSLCHICSALTARWFCVREQYYEQDGWTNELVKPKGLRKGSTWMSLNREHAHMVVDDVIVDDLWVQNCGKPG